MKLLTQMLFGGFSLSGGCCAVSFPLAFNSGSSSGKAKSVTLKRCQASEGSSEVQFSDNSEQTVCGKAVQDTEGESSGVNSLSDTSKDELLNKVLESLWIKGAELGKTGDDGKGKDECQDSIKGWKITSENQEVIKGYCENNFNSGDTSSNLSFLELSEDGSQKLRVCINGNQCGTGNYDPQRINTFSTKDGGEWYDLKFYKE